jgi:hypothetical protein
MIDTKFSSGLSLLTTADLAGMSGGSPRVFYPTSYREGQHGGLSAECMGLRRKGQRAAEQVIRRLPGNSLGGCCNACRNVPL